MTSPIALIFGGSRGTGAACVDALGTDGYQVAHTFVRQGTAARGAYAADIRDAAAVRGMFDAVERRLRRRPDGGKANAGINLPAGPLAQDKARRAVAKVPESIMFATKGDIAR